MFNNNFIREVIKNQLNSGNNKFIIYPFGSNGVAVKNCLLDYFDIQPEMIIDNECSKYNSNIKDIKLLKENYKNDFYIIVSAEDRELNDKLQKELALFVPNNNIINLLRIRDGYNREITNQFSLRSFLPDIWSEPQKKTVVKEKRKIKVRFLHTVYAFWNSIETICVAFSKDNNYELLIILGEHKEDCDLRREQVKRRGYSYIMWNEYNAETDLADILIITHLWEETVLENCRRYIKLIVVAAMSLIRYSYSTKHFAQIVQIGYEKFKPDYYLFDSLVYEEIKDDIFFRGKIAELGNAKFDGIYEACKQKCYPDGWEKLKQKRVILWASDHGIKKGKIINEIRDEITFDLYAKVIFDYFCKKNDIGLIFRPHPAFISEMIEMGYWGLKDLNFFREYCSNSKNIVFDESETYNTAYSVSDAIITDALCGVTCSALPTLKPICILFRTDKIIEPFAGKLTKSYYSAYNEDELTKFFNMIVSGDDPMIELRKKVCQKYIKHFDGNNGLRIKQFIESKYEKQLYKFDF